MDEGDAKGWEFRRDRIYVGMDFYDRRTGMRDRASLDQ
jgi:hypothetical protein